MSKNIENTMDAREKLAQEIVDGWALNDLVYYATWQMVDYYNSLTDEQFTEEYQNHHNDE